jgi:hypothetical protein
MADPGADEGGPGEVSKQYITENTYILEPEGYGEVSSYFVLCRVKVSQLKT